jgi:hypothetical protein
MPGRARKALRFAGAPRNAGGAAPCGQLRARGRGGHARRARERAAAQRGARGQARGGACGRPGAERACAVSRAAAGDARSSAAALRVRQSLHAAGAARRAPAPRGGRALPLKRPCSIASPVN